MSIVYPTSLDSLVNPLGSDIQGVVDHAQQHSNANDAIEALETKVGINSSADASSLDYKVDALNTAVVTTLPNLILGRSPKLEVTVGLVSGECDYLCDGVDDDVEIQAAIDAVNTAGGGVVYIKPGTFLVSSNIKYKDNVHVIGSGRGATIVKQADGANLTGSTGIFQPYRTGESWSVTTQKLLLHFNGKNGDQGVTNYGSDTGAITFYGDAQIDTAQYKFGSNLSSPLGTYTDGSLLLNGTTDYIGIPDSTNFALGTGDFTFDFWVRFNSVATDQVIFSQLTNSTTRYLLQWIHAPTNLLAFQVSNGGLVVNATAPFTPVADTWYHIELSKESNVYRFFVGGVQSGADQTVADAIPDCTGDFFIGKLNIAGSEAFFNGWIEEFRFSKGVAQHTSDFDVPTHAYYPPQVLVSNVSISHMSIDGNMANNNSPATYLEGIIMYSVDNGRIFDVDVYNCSEGGINTASMDYYDPATADAPMTVDVISCKCYNNGGTGFALVSGLFLGCIAFNNNGDGFNITGCASTGPNSVASFIGCGSYNNAGGIITDFQTGSASFPIMIDGCIVRNNLWGILVEMENTSIRNSNIIYNQTDGIKLTANHVRICGNVIKNNGHGPFTNVYNTKAGIQLANGLTDLEIMDNDIYDDQSTKTQEYAIANLGTVTTYTRCRVENNHFYGNSVAPMMTDITTSTGIKILNNEGYNPVGMSTITVTASPFTHVAASSPETVYVSGGTVSAVVKGGVTAFANTGHSIELLPGESVVVTYSGLPTMSKDVH